MEGHRNALNYMNITISVDGYKEKPLEKDVPKIQYLKRNVGLKEIAEYISTGHAISANFKHKRNCVINQGQRKADNFESTCFVMMDLDGDVNLTLKELNENLPVKPTICYTTYRHQKDGLGNRYRLLYCFKEPIRSIPVYQALYDRLTIDNGLKLNDGCGRNCVQAVYGTYFANDDYALYNNDVMYSIASFLGSDYKSVFTEHIKNEDKSIIQYNDTFSIKPPTREHTILHAIFMEDYQAMSISKLIEKYSIVYANIEETPLPYTDEDTPYILYPADYCCIQRRWYPYQVLNKDGDVIATTTRVRKFRDGERRRRKLFFNGILRRLITKDTISYDNLLFNLLYEFYYFYVHTDISKKDICEIASKVWDADLTRYESLKGTSKKYRVNPAYCIKYDLTKKQTKQVAAKQLNSLRIGELYDCLRTDEENLQTFRNNGLKISLSTLKRWRKENGISKYQRLSA